MGFIIGLLTFLLVLDCAMLILLVLIQLPKKDAGAGLAFGAGASDALFGAGSGNVLTKITKYATVAFFILAFVLAVIQRHRSTSSTTEFEKRLSQPAAAPALPATTPVGGTAPSAPQVVSNAAAPAAVATNLLSVPAPANTNAPAK